jgi:hypothetical protein
MSLDDDMDENSQCGGDYREPSLAASGKNHKRTDQALSNDGEYLSDKSASKLMTSV